MSNPSPSDTPTGVAVSNRVPQPDAEEKLDAYLSNKVGPSLKTLFTDSKVMNVETMLKLTMMAVHETPDLAKCSLPSIALALHKVARLGLVIGEGVYLVPIKGSCEVWPGYKGLMQLAMESGLCRSMIPHVVYDTDVFEYEFGSNQFLKHRPGQRKPTGDQPVITHAWADITLRFGRQAFWVMDYATIDARRLKSKNPILKNEKTSPAWYCLKTVLRDWLNRQPLGGKLKDALAEPDQEEEPLRVAGPGEVEVVDKTTGEVSFLKTGA